MFTWDPPVMVKDMLHNAGGSEGKYLRTTFWNSICPWEGQSLGMARAPQESSWGISMYFENK